MTSYKTCAVPMCKSTTIKFPDKLFIHVPNCPKRRKQWLRLARRDPKFTSDKSTIFFCEDHFDLSNDMENYTQYSMMGSVGKIRMKPGCLPSKFQCQPDRIKRTASPQPRSAAIKRQRMNIIQEIFSEETQTLATSGMTSNSDFLCAAEKDDCSNFQDQVIQVWPETTNKLIQVCLSTKTTNRNVQTSTQSAGSFEPTPDNSQTQNVIISAFGSEPMPGSCESEIIIDEYISTPDNKESIHHHTETAPTETADWSQYTPSMLRNARNPALTASPLHFNDVEHVEQQSPTPLLGTNDHPVTTPRNQNHAPATVSTSRRRPALRRDKEVQSLALKRISTLELANIHAKEESMI